MKIRVVRGITGLLHSRNLKQDILLAMIIFVLIYLVLGSATGELGNPVDCIANGDFSSGTDSNSSALNWTQLSNGGATTEWISGDENMRMQVSGSSNSGNGFCNQSFVYNSNADSAVLNFSWKTGTEMMGGSSFSVELKDPSGNIDTIWSNSSNSGVDWSDENVNVTNYMDETGTYTLSLHAYLTSGDGDTSNACVKWDNVSLVTQHGSSSGASTAPFIYNVMNSIPTGTQVYITWDTDQSDSNNRIRYSVNPDLSASNWSGWANNTDSVNISLTDLDSSTGYYYSAYSYNGTDSSYYSNSSIHDFTTAARGLPPAIQSHWNNKTDDSLDLPVKATEPIEFGVTFNQTGNITWDATGNPLRFNDSVDSANQTFAWNTHGIKHLKVSMKNDNGTSEILTWNITVTRYLIYVNETGWWFEDGQFNQSNTPIQSAVDNATSGSCIFVYNGSYTENVVINKPIRLEGEGRDVVFVSAKTTTDVFYIESSWVDISGFTIKDSINSGIYLYESDHCNISWNNISSNWYYGIYLIKSNYNNISNNIVMDNHRSGNSGGEAISIHDYSEHNTITDNTIEHNIYGLFIDSNSGNNTVHTNVVKDNRDGVYIAGRYNLIYNNYILFNDDFDVVDLTGQNAWNITKTPGINILNGSYLGGNYYSDYTGCDADGDGLGDTPYLISDKDTKGYHPLVSSIRILGRWNSKTQNNLTLAANLSEEVDFFINYSQIGDIRWNVWKYIEGSKTIIENRENTSCFEANQSYSWNEPGTKYVDVWLTNGNGTSNKTEWVVSVNTNVRGQVKDNSSNPVISDISYYDTDGETVLANNMTTSTFNFTGVPLYGYLEIDAFSTKNASARFCISGTSGNAVITIDETKEKPASFKEPGIPIKYIKLQPTSLAYNSSTLKIRYHEDELNGVSESALSIYRMEGNSWNKLPTQRDTVNNILTASPPSPGWFAVACPAGIGVCTQLKISTDKATYLLDPYYWVHEAPDSLWPSDGYNRTVNFTVLLMDHRGYRVAVDEVHYNVGNSSTIIASGDAYNRGDGLYTASFNITDADAGGINFNGSVLESITIHVEASSNGNIIDGSKTFGVGRWGCDRCHIEQSLAESIYSWCKPSGGQQGHHSWTNILGESDDQFNLSYLTNSELTHTPREYLDTYPWHEKTKSKMSNDETMSDKSRSSKCSPCHQGSGVVRADNSRVVECTFCHGIDGGHNTTYWPDNAGYAYGEHTKVEPPSSTSLAEQSCSNASCHGHINDSYPGEIDNAYPACSSCHPISFGSDVPQWQDTSTGEPRDVGGHPNDEPVVNCSFCHNSFHSLFDESDVLTCDDCHPESKDYPVHPYEGYQGSSTATCANCHCGDEHLNIHNISIPGCKDCHSDVYMDINEGYNNYAMADDPDNLAPAGSNMTHKRDTEVALQWGSDPQGLSGSGNAFYSRHACPESSEGWPGATGSARNGDQICINCHSKIVRDAGAWHDDNWKRDDYYSCKPCHNLWSDDAIYGSPNVHYLSAPHCTDCHAATLPDPWHGTWDPENPPKNYMRTPAIGLMLEDSIHGRLVMNTTTGKPSNYLGCLICHTGVDFNITYNDFEITITNYSGAHTWNSKPDCTKCHSIDPDVECPGPYPNAHDILGMEWGNNTECLICHNIYNQTAGRYHGHDATTESCTGCHFDYQAMDDYGKPSVYVNETMYADSVHGTKPGANCTQCHTKSHPPPEYTWKWCECCHSYQSEPVADTNRHNITNAPLSYMSGGVSVLEITDCTECHDATLYNNSKETFSRSSGKDCRYCHTYPDQVYY